MCVCVVFVRPHSYLCQVTAGTRLSDLQFVLSGKEEEEIERERARGGRRVQVSIVILIHGWPHQCYL